ncbi:MAG: hypothetical protein GDA51_03490 [Ekhidna sp.]|nr:hypothetical protein [Ekhidna sp.]MBC6409841.1 hypothetical protein [Ekhidna sp.]MBC6425530.1 hypothetical protein [Ekhidna sp.]
MEKVIRIVDKKDSGFDTEYWANKSPKERIEALEILRNQVLTKNGIRQEFQRVYRVIKR